MSKAPREWFVASAVVHNGRVRLHDEAVVIGIQWLQHQTLVDYLVPVENREGLT